MRSAKKVALNTAILYGRMVITIGISLYTTRLVLNVLGAVDYGIYNLVAGVVAMLSFLNAAMTVSTQRYLSYYAGKQDKAMQRKVFTNSMLLHIGVGILIVVCLELAGFVLFDGFLNIPVDKIHDARVVYHFMSVTVFFTIISVPFTASLTARENMLWIALVNIVETLLKLSIALVLVFIDGKKLIYFGLFTAGISVITFLLYTFFCIRKYPECTFKNILDKDMPLIRELSAFAGWNLFGALCSVGRVQGLAILLNLFFGTVVNAAYALANQVSAQLNFFSITILRAINPQIMKSEGANDRARMLRLSMIASKFSFFLLALIAVPGIFEMDKILKLWLKNVPQYTVIFCDLILIGALINQLTIGLQSAIQATGKVKMYQIIVGSALLLNLPVAFILLKSGLPSYIVLASYCCMEAVACSLRIYFANRLAGLSVSVYIRDVIFRQLAGVGIGALVYWSVFSNLLNTGYLVNIFIAFSLLMMSIYFFGISNTEKSMLEQLFRKGLNKVFKVQLANK